MTQGVTSRQDELLSLLKRLPYTPSYEQMRTALGLGSKSGVARIVEGLEERGLIERIPNRARAIRVVEKPAMWTSPLAEFGTGELVAELDRRGYFAGASRRAS